MAQLANQASKNPDFQQRISATNAEDLESALRSVYRYRDEREEIVRSPEFMLNDLEELGYIEGDCDDISTLSAAALKALGYHVRFMAITYTPGHNEFEHVYVEVWNGEEWMPFDVTIAPGMKPRAILKMVQEV